MKYSLKKIGAMITLLLLLIVLVVGISCFAGLIILDYWLFVIGEYIPFVLCVLLSLLFGFILLMGIREETKVIKLIRQSP